MGIGWLHRVQWCTVDVLGLLFLAAIRNAGVVTYRHDVESDGSYEDIQVHAQSVDDIAPIVAVYAVLLTAVAVVVAAVAILGREDDEDGHETRSGAYLTVVGNRLSRSTSDYAEINVENVLLEQDYERLLREQFHIYTTLNPSAVSTEDHSTRCSLM